MIYEDDQLRERIHQLMHREKMSLNAFAIAIGQKAPNMYKIMSGQRRIPKSLPTGILGAFEKVRKDWLLFGDGPMCDGDEVKAELPLNTRPRLPKSVSGGHLEDYYSGPKRSLCQEKPIITQFPDYDFSLIVKNYRMSPKYDRGDELFFKKCKITEWGNDILLDTADGPKFKKVMDDGDSVRCMSYNKEEYPDFSVPKELIYGYYRLVGVLRIL